MKKDKFTFAEKAIILMISMGVIIVLEGIFLLSALDNNADISKPIKIIAAILVTMLAAVIAIFINRWLLSPYREYKTLFRRFLSGKIYQELIDKAYNLIPGLGDVLQQFSKMLNTQKIQQETKKQSEFLALQNQINPHFLYNTLEAIRGDALSGGMDNIADITEALSTFFRYTITDTGSLVTLADEMENVDNYFRIQKYRFGDKLEIVYEISEAEEEVLSFLCPKLTMQPIIENAIFHGLEKKSVGGTVRIQIELTDTKVLVSIKDDGVGIEEAALDVINNKLENMAIAYSTEDKSRKGGIALNNVCRRIKLLFGEEYGVHVYSLIGVGTDVRVTLPIMKKEREFSNEGRINSN